MAIGPISYDALLVQPNFSGLGAIAAQIQQRRAAEQQRKAAEAQKAQMNADIEALGENPNAAALMQFSLKYPQLADAAGKGWQAYSDERKNQNLQDMVGIASAVDAGRDDLALKIIGQRKSSLVASGEQIEQTEAAESLIQQIQSARARGDEAEAMRLGRQLNGILAYGIGVATGFDKFDDVFANVRKTQREDALSPGMVRKTDAEAAIAEAQAQEAPAQQRALTRRATAEASTAETTAEFAPEQQQTAIEKQRADIRNIDSVIQDRANRLDLDRDRLESDVGIALERMDYDRTKLSDGQAAKVAEYVTGAEASRSVARRAQDLANRFEEAQRTGQSSGLASWIGDKTGISSSDAAQLRRDYAGLINSQAVKNLPPGAASDSDIQLALAGFPPRNAKPETVTRFLRGLAKLQEAAANSDQAKADWLANNGNLGPAQRDLYVNGTRVPKGTTYGEFSKTRGAFERKETERDAISNRSYMKYAR